MDDGRVDVSLRCSEADELSKAVLELDSAVLPLNLRRLVLTQSLHDGGTRGRRIPVVGFHGLVLGEDVIV